VIPSITRWIEDVAERLLDGRRLVVQGAPGSGKTFLADAVCALLGDSAIRVEGRAFTEQNQVTVREGLMSKASEAVDRHGFGQIIFDDYHLALRRSQGRSLQNSLVSLLVDGEKSRDLGALLFSRFAGPIHIDGRGSPLISRCDFVTLPAWSNEDLAQTGFTSREVMDAVGDLAANLDRLAINSNWVEHRAQQMRAGLASTLDDLSAEAIRAVELANLEHAPRASDREALRGLFADVGLSAIAIHSGIQEACSQLSEGWPSALSESAARFARLLEGQSRALWSDRYLFKDVGLLEKFLSAVRGETDTRILLLGTLRPGDMTVDPRDLIALCETVPNVEARVMLSGDRRDLHDRHLVFLQSASGWVLPTADVIMCATPAGSAVASRVPRFGIDYQSIWERSRRV